MVKVSRSGADLKPPSPKFGHSYITITPFLVHDVLTMVCVQCRYEHPLKLPVHFREITTHITPACAGIIFQFFPRRAGKIDNNFECEARGIIMKNNPDVL